MINDLHIFLFTAFAIRCYECNSYFQKECSDFFDNKTFNLEKCGDEITMCRKMVLEGRMSLLFPVFVLKNELTGIYCRPVHLSLLSWSFVTILFTIFLCHWLFFYVTICKKMASCDKNKSSKRNSRRPNQQINPCSHFSVKCTTWAWLCYRWELLENKVKHSNCCMVLS